MSTGTVTLWPSPERESEADCNYLEKRGNRGTARKPEIEDPRGREGGQKDERLRLGERRRVGGRERSGVRADERACVCEREELDRNNVEGFDDPREH